MYQAYKQEREEGRYKLIYFNGKGRAETIRLLFAASGTHYHDQRITKEEWAELKPNVPYGQLPVLDVEREMIGQSNAIARFVSKQVGMEGATPLEQAMVDSICDVITEIREKAAKVRFMKDEEERAKTMAEFAEYYPQKFDILQGMMQYHDKCESKSGSNDAEYFVGKSMTRADLHFYATVELLQSMIPDLIQANQPLVDLYARVQQQDNVAKYLEARPETEF